MKKGIIFLFSIIVIFFVTEIYLSIFQNNLVIKNIFSKYSDLEKDKTLDFKLKKHGFDCVKPRFITKMQWNPRYGWSDKEIDINCIDSLFKKNTVNTVFFGDSTIDNYEAPNYLTSLEYFTFGESDKFRSINLSEGGSRLSDQIALFLEYIPKLKTKPSIAFFFNGYHEFTSIQYNGNPKYNFYWTTTINNRIHNPIIFFYQAILDKSKILKFISNKLLKINHSRNKILKVDKKKIILAAEEYNYQKHIAENICEIYNIKCFFILQPIFVKSKNLNGNIDNYLKEKLSKSTIEHDKELYDYAYNYILSKEDNVLNFSNLFDNQDNIFFDYVRLNKYGIEIISEELKKLISY
jgi:hypothetical protein